VADLPHPVAAAPTPAYNAGQSHLVLFGGDDGLNAPRVAELKDNHPGFRNEILSYNTITNSWSVMGSMPVDIKADASTHPHASILRSRYYPLVVWENNIVIAGGEARPAVRSNKVLIVPRNSQLVNLAVLTGLSSHCTSPLVVGISLYVSKNMGNTTGDFFLGGQKISLVGGWPQHIRIKIKCPHFYRYSCKSLCNRLGLYHE
jgi:hypothetical protein